MGLFPLAISQVLRGRRTTFASIIGIALTVAFLSGTFIAIDSSLNALLDESLVYVQADFVLTASTNRTGDLVRELETIPGVVSVAPFASMYLEVGRWGESTSTGVQGLAVDPLRLPSVFKATDLLGTMTLPRGSAVVSEIVASEVGVTLGDAMYLSGFAYNSSTGSDERRFVNVTIEGIVVLPADREPPRFAASPPSERFVAVHLQDGSWFSDRLFAHETPFVVVEILVDRALLLNPQDVEASRRNMGRVEVQLRGIAGTYGSASVVSPISSIIENLGNALPLFRGIYLALSLPLIVLGISLGAVGVDLGHSERRRELAVLKTRGASRGQVWRLLILESIVVGILAAVIGLIVGIGMSRVIAPSATFFVASTPRFEDLVLNPTTMGTTAAFSILLTLAASYRSAKRTATLPIVETLRYYVPGEAKLQYSRTPDAILVALAIGTYALDLSAGLVGGGLLGFLAGPLFFILLPLAPFLFLVSFTRLATRSTPRMYEAVSRLLRPFAMNLQHLIGRNLGRNPRRASNIAVLIALGVALSIFVLSFSNSLILREERILRASIGADIAGVSPSGDATFADNLTLVPGVAVVTLLFVVPASPDVTPLPFDTGVFALDPGTYFAAALPEPWYFVDGNSERARDVLATTGRVLVSEAFLDQAFLEVGDPLRLHYTVINVSGEPEGRHTDVVIGGSVRGLPGFPASSDFLPRAIYGSISTFDPILSAGAPGTERRPKFLVDLAPGTDEGGAREAVIKLGGTEVRSFEEERATTNRNPAARNVLEFLSLQLVFILIVLTAGLSLITYTASLERDVEFAGIIARGASGWQAASLLLGEALCIVMIGSLVGVTSGIGAVYGGARVFGAGPGGEAYAPLVPFPFVIPIEAIILVGLAFLVMLVASLFVSWRIARMDVARILKRRAG